MQMMTDVRRQLDAEAAAEGGGGGGGGGGSGDGGEAGVATLSAS